MEMFKCILQSDSPGPYPGLELISFILGSEHGLLPETTELRITRSAHDFARRLDRDEFFDKSEIKQVLADDFSVDSIRKLLRCLELDLENITKQPTWSRIHFFPYTKSLSHWDSRIRKGKAALERKYYRGAGAYAFNVLRFDENKQRLLETTENLKSIFYPKNESPLEVLAKTLIAHSISDSNPVEDEVESRSIEMLNDDAEELYRLGVFNILSHKSLPSVTKIKSIVNWTGIWLVILANFRLPNELSTIFIFDCGGVNPQLRKASQRSVKDFIKNISSSIELKRGNREITGAQSQKIKGFFGSTLAHVKLINSLKGRRHFTFGLNAIETLTLAAVSSNQEVPLDTFLNSWLFDKCKFVIGRNAAEKSGLLERLDATIFEANEKRLADQILAVGMLKVYSDATKMVCVGEIDD